MKSLNSISKDELERINYIFTDVDDTLTEHGLLNPQTFAALHQLDKNGYKTVTVSGGSAADSYHMARTWPIHGAIAESGALYFRRINENIEKKYWYSLDKLAEIKKKLEIFSNTIMKEIPGTRFALDQSYRELDIAIDHSQTKPKYSEHEIDKFFLLSERFHANITRSSIHLNIWYGDHSKLGMIKRYAEKELDLSIKVLFEKSIFIGDGLNDQMMFQAFPLSVGVANIKKDIKSFQILPKFITQNQYGNGFNELATLLLQS